MRVGGGMDAPSFDVPAISVAFEDARAIAVDGLGDLFVSDAMLGEVFKVTIATGVISDVISGFQTPAGLFVDEHAGDDEG